MLFTQRKFFPFFAVIPLTLFLWLSGYPLFQAASIGEPRPSTTESPSEGLPKPEPASKAAGATGVGTDVASIKVCLDRFEGDTAVLLPDTGGEPLIVPAASLPELARESDLLEVTLTSGGEVTNPTIDWEATRLAQQRIRALFSEIVSGPSGES